MPRKLEPPHRERQRVLLARASVANPRILVLDEATAKLDLKTEDAVKKTLRERTRGRTTLLIAHRHSMLTEVDRVVAIRDGGVIEEGTPADLFGPRGYSFQMMIAQPKGPELHIQQARCGGSLCRARAKGPARCKRF